MLGACWQTPRLITPAPCLSAGPNWQAQQGKELPAWMGSMQRTLPETCADRCWLGPVHAIFERCVALEKVTRQGTSRRQEQTWVGAWSKSFRVCASATTGRDRNAHCRQDCPLWQGMRQGACSLAALPEGVLCKGSICRVANAALGSTHVFVPCFVLCALQLLPVHSKAHGVKPSNRLSWRADHCRVVHQSGGAVFWGGGAVWHCASALQRANSHFRPSLMAGMRLLAWVSRG